MKHEEFELIVAVGILFIVFIGVFFFLPWIVHLNRHDYHHVYTDHSRHQQQQKELNGSRNNYDNRGEYNYKQELSQLGFHIPGQQPASRTTRSSRVQTEPLDRALVKRSARKYFSRVKKGGNYY